MTNLFEVDEKALDYEVEAAAEDLSKALKQSIRAIAVTKATRHACAMAPAPCVQSVNRRELAALYALVHYTAFNLNARLEAIHDMVEAKFKAPRVADLPQHEYDNAVRFLLDMSLDMSAQA